LERLDHNVPKAKNRDMKSIRVLMLAAVVGGTLAAQPVVNPGGVLNASSYSTTNPPGSLIVIFGVSMAGGTGLLKASTTPLSMSLKNNSDTISVTVNGKAAPMFYASNTQTSVQLPWEVSPGNASIVVTRNGTASAPQQMQVGQFSPGIFTLTQDGKGKALAFNAIPITVNGKPALAIAQPTGSVPGLPAVPAKANDHLLVYCTGLGPVALVNGKPIADGAAPCALSGCKTTDVQRKTTTQPKVLVGGVSAKVEFSGLAPQFVGVYQLNFQVPTGVPTGDAVPLQIEIGNITTLDNVTIAVQ
jgi:uncharacterized protein (TIGR03437 family)